MAFMVIRREQAASGPLAYVGAGATHMLTGYDHLLFLFGVMFFLTSFREIVIVITAFTISHSITLIFATLYGIQANYDLTDVSFRTIRHHCEHVSDRCWLMPLSHANAHTFGYGLPK